MVGMMPTRLDPSILTVPLVLVADDRTTRAADGCTNRRTLARVAGG